MARNLEGRVIKPEWIKIEHVNRLEKEYYLVVVGILGIQRMEIGLSAQELMFMNLEK